MRRGFTLIELLVVMAIIAILAGLIIGIAGNVQKQAAKARARAEIGALETALERFKLDNGDYPDWQAAAISSGSPYDGDANNYPSRLVDSGATAGRRSLFEQLVGRRQYDSADTTGSNYIEIKQSQTGVSGSDAFFMDPFGFAYGYAYEDDPAGGEPKSAFNQVVPDLWSTSGETEEEDLDLNDPIYLNWMTNWANR